MSVYAVDEMSPFYLFAKFPYSLDKDIQNWTMQFNVIVLGRSI